MLSLTMVFKMEIKMNKYLLCSLLLLFPLITFSASTSNSQQIEEYKRQSNIYNAQSKITEELQTETDRQLKESARLQRLTAEQLEMSGAQQKRMEKLLERWENQAERYDALLDKWEKQKK